MELWSNNMKQQGLALHVYADVHPEQFPAGWVGEYDGGVGYPDAVAAFSIA